VNATATPAYLAIHRFRRRRLNDHLMPANKDEAVALVDAYLGRANGSERLAEF
jgi:hypothetical protein